MSTTDDKSKTRKKATSTGNVILIAVLAGAIGFGAAHLAGSKSGDIVDNNITQEDATNYEYTYEEEINYDEPIVVEDITFRTDDYNQIVNDDVYKLLLESRNNFEYLYSNGSSVAEQMKNHGISLEPQHADYVDRDMIYNFEIICNYIVNYEKGDYDKAYEYGKILCDDYVTHMSPQYLYALLVIPHLNEEFVSDYQYVEDNTMYLNNGNKIRLIGDEDPLFDPKDDIINRFEYYRDLPIIILDNYDVIYDENYDSSTCNLINVSHTDRLCNAELYELKQRASEKYGISSDELRIVWNNDADSWVFTNSEDEFIDYLNEEDNSKFEAYWTIIDATSHNSGDTDLVDEIVDDLDERYDYVR